MYAHYSKIAGNVFGLAALTDCCYTTRIATLFTKYLLSAKGNQCIRTSCVLPNYPMEKYGLLPPDKESSNGTKRQKEANPSSI